MPRRTFADLIRQTGVNYRAEMTMLCNIITSSAARVFRDAIFHDYVFGDDSKRRSFLDMCNQNFDYFPVELIGTCRTVDEFNDYYNCHPKVPVNCGLDDVLMLAEYVFTFAIALDNALKNRNDVNSERQLVKNVVSHLNRLLDRLHHRAVGNGVWVVLVPTDATIAEAVRELPDRVAIDTFMYRHRSMAGDIESKKRVLKALGDQLEPMRDNIQNSALRGAIFNILNNMNLRHNNVDPADAGKYRPFVANMAPGDLEKWYDRLYSFMINAFTGLNVRDDLNIYEQNKEAIGQARRQ